MHERDTFSHVPQNSTYSTFVYLKFKTKNLVEALRSSLAKDIKESDVNWFSLMRNRMRDKNNPENIVVAIRNIKDEIVNRATAIITACIR